MPDFIMDGETWSVSISAREQQVLREQKIDEHGPGSVLRDFDTLLSFVGKEGLKTTGKFYFVPNSKLDELNAQMSRPVIHRLKRTIQRALPHLHGLYALLRASGIGVGVGIPPNGRLMIDPQMLSLWRKLNPTERYFTLLESWLVHATPNVIAERGGWSGGFFDTLIHLHSRLRDRRTDIPQDRFRGGVFYGTMPLVTAALLELFGWARLEYGRPAAGEGVKAVAIERLAFGDAMLCALNVWHLSGQWPHHREAEPAQPGIVRPLLKPYFPKWRHVLKQPQAARRDGVYTLRVSKGRAWQRLLVPGHLNLHDVAVEILACVTGFEDAYFFEYQDRHGRTRRITCPHMLDGDLYADKVGLADLQLAEGSIMYLVRYRNPRFTLKLEQIGPPDPALSSPLVIAEGGPLFEEYE